MTERYKTRKNIRIFFIILFLVVVLGYTGYEIQRVVLGPIIRVDSPKNGAIVSTSSIEIRGVAKNIQDISLDGRKIFIDEKGNFSEELLMSPGYNVITLDASDKFGRQTEKTLEIVYQ